MKHLKSTQRVASFKTSPRMANLPLPAVELRAVGVVLFLLLTLAQASFAQLSGPLSGTLGPGTFYIVGEISVESGNSLTLQPRTTFHFDGPYPFRIYGTLLAEGTESDSIIFTTDPLTNPDKWRGLRFSGSSSSNSRLSYCLVEKGLASGGYPDNTGGGIFCYNCSPTFANCVISNNAASSGGGVSCWLSSSPDFTDCIIRNNLAYSDGGGVDCYSASATFTNCIITDNQGNNRGGGIDCYSSSSIFTNCLITDNIANYGGAVRGVSGGGTFNHCVLSGNSGYLKGECFDCLNVSFIVTNCILTAVDNEAIYFESSSGSQFEHCCIFRSDGEPIAFLANRPSEGPAGIGELVTMNTNGDSCDTSMNIFRGPRFVDDIVGDFHLIDYSPCIGAGQTSASGEDLDGNPRPTPSGSQPDIGAYENALAAPLQYEELSGSLSGALGPGIYSITGAISVSDGASLQLLPGTVFLFEGPYAFEVRGTLLAEGVEGDSIVFTSDLALPNRWRGLRFYDSASSSSRLAYCVIEHAYHSNNGGGVFLSESSPNFMHCMIRDDLAGNFGGGVYCYNFFSTFSSCTFSGNSADGGGAVFCDVSSPNFSDCVFTNNYSYSAGGAVYRGNGDFVNCTFSGNSARSGGGGVYRSSGDFTNCVFMNNYASNGGAVKRGEGVFKNCVIVGNTAQHDGGGIEDPYGTFVNCIIAGNSAGEGGGIDCRSSSAAFINCVIIGNTVPVGERGGNVYCDYSASTFKNTIIAFSEGAEGFFFDHSRSSHIEHCAFFGNSGGDFNYWSGPSDAPPGLGLLDTININSDSCDTYFNIYLNPLLRDIENGDYHLMATYCDDSVDSPCIDAGDPLIEDHTLSCDFGLGTLVSDIGAFGGDTTVSDATYLDEPLIPAKFVLHQNYPNPFNPTTNIRYDIAQNSRVTLTIYNLLGQQVTKLIDKQHQPGSYNITWNATHLPSGLYFCRMQAGSFTQVRKLMLLK